MCLKFFVRLSYGLRTRDVGSRLYKSMYHSCFVKDDLNLFSLWELFKPILVGFKFSTLKIQVTNRLNPTENSLFTFSISDFHLAKLRLTKHVLLVSIISR